MAAQNEIKPPEWVFPGARVVVWKRHNGNDSDAYVDTVKSVGKQWITLEKLDHRVSVNDLQTANRASGRYSNLVYCIEEEYSERGQRMLDGERIRRSRLRVTAQFEAWQKDPLNAVARAGLRKAIDQLDRAIALAGE